MQRKVYKVFTAADLAEAQARGRFLGSADDRQDGYIHFSSREQLAGTLARHFAGQRDLVLAAFDEASLGPALRWEPARDGSLFPHLYSDLDPSLARSIDRLVLGDDGRHILPEGLA
ncbi:MAG: DUF952 domain-containing protein [Hyphomicrobiaceae bacterium]|nr:DUF952 domain-containing protein [Hyphomicrobiaceae bacterium]